jgi:hypothetical protein
MCTIALCYETATQHALAAGVLFHQQTLRRQAPLEVSLRWRPQGSRYQYARFHRGEVQGPGFGPRTLWLTADTS